MSRSFAQTQASQLNFLGGNPKLQLSNITDDMARKLAGGQLQDGFDDQIYDSFVLIAGTAITPGQYPLFNTPVGQPRHSINDATSWNTLLNDTNMKQAATLAADETFWVRSIQITIKVLGSVLTTYASGRPTALTATAAQDGANLLQALQEAVWFTNKLANKEYENNSIAWFPSEQGITGYAGAGITADSSIVAQNGFGRAKQLTVWHEIVGKLTTINPYLTFFNALTPLQTVVGHVAYDGIRFRSVQ
jgi:hypothetical protein